MKIILPILVFFILLSCKNEKKVNPNDKYPLEMDEEHRKIHEEIDKVSVEVQKFRLELVSLYKKSEINPDITISSVDSFLILKAKDTDKYRLQIKKSNLSDLHYLKAELYYKSGKYEKSLAELEKTDYKFGDNAAAYAANYVKLKDYIKAKSFIDSIGKGWYIYDYALGNYYESTNNKAQALNIYNSIKNKKSIKHYVFYKLTIDRLIELEKTNSKLLNEIYFPTGNPSFEICDSDNENRTKIFKLMEKLPENKEVTTTSILESPQENDKNYYWVRVNTIKNEEFNYYIYQNTFEVKFFDPKSKKVMTLKEWRGQK